MDAAAFPSMSGLQGFDADEFLSFKPVSHFTTVAAAVDDTATVNSVPADTRAGVATSPDNVTDATASFSSSLFSDDTPLGFPFRSAKDSLCAAPVLKLEDDMLPHQAALPEQALQHKAQAAQGQSFEYQQSRTCYQQNFQEHLRQQHQPHMLSQAAAAIASVAPGSAPPEDRHNCCFQHDSYGSSYKYHSQQYEYLDTHHRLSQFSYPQQHPQQQPQVQQQRQTHQVAEAPEPSHHRYHCAASPSMLYQAPPPHPEQPRSQQQRHQMSSPPHQEVYYPAALPTPQHSPTPTSPPRRRRSPAAQAGPLNGDRLAVRRELLKHGKYEELPGPKRYGRGAAPETKKKRRAMQNKISGEVSRVLARKKLVSLEEEAFALEEREAWLNREVARLSAPR